MVKNNTDTWTGSLDYRFDTIQDGRLVLTSIQQDLPSNTDDYDEYVFYMWFSDSCQSSSLETCKKNGQLSDQSNLLGKNLSGKIEVELYTGSKKEMVRKPSTSLDESTCNYGYLSSIEPGSYVAYIGNNNCPVGHCDGTNANASGTSNGYFYSSDYEFNSSGWRVAYIEDDTAYLISAGAPECMCSNDDGTTSDVGCTGYYNGRDDTILNIVNTHFNNMNNLALKYCNTTYSFNGVCDNTTTWAMTGEDFTKITGETFASNVRSTNDLINNGSYYFFRTLYEGSLYSAHAWSPDSEYVDYYGIPSKLFGVRPVIRLDSSVKIIGGSGTEIAPYEISNN